VNGYKLLFAGPVGVGKSTAIAAISDIKPFQTEEVATDATKNIKQTTTVALDYGLLKLDGGERIHLYGTPGQDRFNFMWEILSEGAIGVILLMNNLEEDPLGTFSFYLESFSQYFSATGLAVGISRMEQKRTPAIDDYHKILSDRGLVAPILEIDPRDRNDVIMLTETLLFNLDPGIE